jgi:hypothetical protein
MTDTEAKVVAAWEEAAADLGVRFTTPFIIALSDGRRQEHLGLVHQFGRRIGTVISVLHEPSERTQHPGDDDYFTSILGPGYTRYERQEFIDTLNDWQFFGPDRERPEWYSGKRWS